MTSLFVSWNWLIEILAQIRIAHLFRGRFSDLSACFVRVELYEAGQARRRATSQQQVQRHAGGFTERVVIVFILNVLSP
jgi:hypothetical protein